jgi:tRNA (mo5U34)-methyltransferase
MDTTKGSHYRRRHQTSARRKFLRRCLNPKELLRLERRQIQAIIASRSNIARLRSVRNVLAGSRLERSGRIDASGTLIAGGRSRKSELVFVARELVSWRTGPYDLSGVLIDAEWRSEVKWKQITPHLPEISGKTILDIGCSSGYFGLRSALLGAELVVGSDVAVLPYTQARLIEGLFGLPNYLVLPLALHHLVGIAPRFDIVLCLGVIFHQRDPQQFMRELRQVLQPGATVILETIGIEGVHADPLIGLSRYAKMGNAHWVPTPTALHDLLCAAGLNVASVSDHGFISSTEQRTTPFAPYQSLREYLDPNNSKLTVEGFPAPRRLIAVATEPREAPR